MIDLDADLGNADWTKQTWDLPCETPEELADYLEMAGIDPALFAELPVAQAAPWLTDNELDDSLLGDTITAGGPMPWHKVKDHSGCTSAKPWAVADKDGKVMGCHENEEKANAQLAALYASEDNMTAAAFTAMQRKRFAKSGVAMEDGSFPVRNKGDLHNAVMSIGRAKDPEAAKRHVIERAKALGLEKDLPEDWEAGEKPDSDDVTAAAWDESKHPRHERGAKGGGQFRRSDLSSARVAAQAGQDWLDEIDDGNQDPAKVQAAQRLANTEAEKPIDAQAGMEVLEEVAAHKEAVAAEWGDPVDPDVAKIKGMGEEIKTMETPPELEEYTPTDDERDSIAYHNENRRKPGQPRPKSEAFAKAVPLSTDEPTRPGQVVKPKRITGEGADLTVTADNGVSVSYDDASGEYVARDANGKKLRRRLIGDEITAQQELINEREKRGIKGRTWKVVDPNLTASAAGMAPLAPPAEWFDDPSFSNLTPLEVTADGQVRGHLASWDSCHIGDPRGPGVCVSPPSSKTDYGFFHLGAVLAADGRKVPVGQITLDTGHAPLGMNARTAAAHYDHTGTAVADVRAGEDRFGIWVAGALRPHVSAEKARSLTAAKLSGDWRGIQGNLEMVGVLAVNVPGFPVPRPEVRLVASGEPEARAALVAAGILEDDVGIAPEIKRETMIARILGRDALLAAAIPRVLRRPQSKEAFERARLVASAWDESKHPRHPKGTKAKGGRFAPKHGGEDTPSVTSDERLSDDKAYDAAIGDAADTVKILVDEAGSLDAIDTEHYVEAIEEPAAALGIDIRDEDVMAKFEEDVLARAGISEGDTGDIEAPPGDLVTPDASDAKARYDALPDVGYFKDMAKLSKTADPEWQLKQVEAVEERIRAVAADPTHEQDSFDKGGPMDQAAAEWVKKNPKNNGEDQEARQEEVLT